MRTRIAQSREALTEMSDTFEPPGLSPTTLTPPTFTPPTLTSQPPSTFADLHCPDCGYSLRGLFNDSTLDAPAPPAATADTPAATADPGATGGLPASGFESEATGGSTASPGPARPQRCPECGLDIEPFRSQVSQIPWSNRKTLGRFRAYWQTVWLVMFKQRRFHTEIVRPVSYSDAQRFRWVTILIAVIALAAVPPTLYLLGVGDVPGTLAQNGWTVPLVCIPSVLLFFVALTGVHTYFFHPRHLPIELQNRVLAMSYYACAPLALTPIACILWIEGANIGEFRHKPVDLALYGCAIGWLLAELFGVWSGLVRLARSALRRQFRVLLVAAGAPVLWLFAAGVILLMPLTVIYLILIIEALG